MGDQVCLPAGQGCRDGACQEGREDDVLAAGDQERRHAEVLQFGDGPAGGAAQALAHLRLVERARHGVDAGIEKVQGGRARRRCHAHRRMDAVGEAGGGLRFGVLHPRIVGAAARRIAAAAIERAGGRAQHQRLHFRRMGDGVFEHRPAAHRLTDQAHVGEFQMIDQGSEIGGVVGGIGAAVDRTGRREAAMGEAHAGVTWREVRDLLPPAQVIAAQAVGEQQRRSAARHLVVEIAERPLQSADAARRRLVGHGAKSPLRRGPA